MSTITKRDAAHLAADIKQAQVMGHALAARTNGASGVYGFLGALEVVLQTFVLKHCSPDVGTAIAEAMNYTPTREEIEAHNKRVADYRLPRHTNSPLRGEA